MHSHDNILHIDSENVRTHMVLYNVTVSYNCSLVWCLCLYLILTAVLCSVCIRPVESGSLFDELTYEIYVCHFVDTV